jgi:putative sterol carrier protein
MRHVTRFFFMQIGSFVPVFVFFYLGGKAAFSADGVRHALLVALVVDSAYIALAWSRGEAKQFDAGIWSLLAFGTLATRAGVAPVTWLYQHYAPTLLFVTLGLTALVPLLLGRETFTYYYARRQFPLWQLKTPGFHDVSRVMTVYWTLLFSIAAGLCAWAPTDWHFTFLYPNLLVFGLGMTATVWLPPLYFRLFPPGFPGAIEPLIMGMPMVFDRKAARDTRASIQFRVTGNEPGDYYLAIARGKCRSFEGIAPAADLTVYTPDTVWMRIVRGELDGQRALQEGLYRAEGDFALLAKLREWFPARR